MYDRTRYSSDRVTVYQQSNIDVGMSFHDNVWSICTKDVLMIDFDFKLGLTR